jgi:hypothetical protein
VRQGLRRSPCPRAGPSRRSAGSAARRLSGRGGRGCSRCAGYDRRHLPGVPARGMRTLFEKDNPRRLKAARQRRLDRAYVPPAVECFAGEENRSTITS